MESGNNPEQAQIQAQAQSPDGGLRYDLCIAQGIIGKARQVFDESQAALGDTQLECYRIFRELQRIKEECERRHDNAVQAWSEYNKMSKRLEAKTLKLKKVEHELGLEVSHLELLEAQQTEYERSLAQDQHIIKDLAEEQVRYIAMVASLQAQIEKDRATIAELQKKLEGYGFNALVSEPSVGVNNSQLNRQVESESSGVAEEEVHDCSATIKKEAKD